MISVDTLHLKQQDTLIIVMFDEQHHFKKDTLVFSVSKSKTLECTEHLETGKTGIVFSTFALLSLGKVLSTEINKEGIDMYFGIYKMKEEQTVSVGQFSFRNINPNRFFDCRGNFITNLEVWPEENICHFEPKNYVFKDRSDFDFILKKTDKDGELFITDEFKSNFELIQLYRVNYATLKNIVNLEQQYEKDEMFGAALTLVK
jgi:hypothetical protein